MNQNQIEALARSAGLPADRARVAAAVAMAESGGNERAHAQDSDDNSYGLWQINMLGSLGPERRRRFNLASNEALFDPATNARVMAALSQQGRAWSPWGAYTNGSYKKFLIGDGLADILPGGNAVQDAGNAVGGGVQAVDDAAVKVADGLNRVTQWITNQQNWVRVLYVVGGSAMALAALGIIAKPAVAGLPTAKLAKVAKSVAR